MIIKNSFKIIMLLFIVCLLLNRGVSAQAVSDYVLLPNSELILPVGTSTSFSVNWQKDGKMIPGTGTAFNSEIATPEWTIDGKIANGDASANGRLSEDLTFTKATYTAPDKVPMVNPVTVAVKFKANDTSKEVVTLICNVKIVNPGQCWYFTYTCSQSYKETWKHKFEEHIKKMSGSGSGSMLINGLPALNGYLLINTDQGDSGNPVTASTVNGSYQYYESDIVNGTGGDLEEKRIINYFGKPEKGQGLEFEYNAKDKGDQGGIQTAGISFDITGTDETWNLDVNGKLRKFSSNVDQKNFNGIGLGHKEDKITIIKNGYAIDYDQSKDTTYPKANDLEHTLTSTEKYHAELIRINKK